MTTTRTCLTSTTSSAENDFTSSLSSSVPVLDDYDVLSFGFIANTTSAADDDDDDDDGGDNGFNTSSAKNDVTSSTSSFASVLDDTTTTMTVLNDRSKDNLSRTL